jgi:hypothetical protein
MSYKSRPITTTAQGIAGLVVRFTMSNADQTPPASTVRTRAKTPNDATVKMRLGSGR